MRTPMHLAAMSGYIEVVEYLVENGYEVNPKDRWGSTPLNDATDDEIIEFLEANGGERGTQYQLLEIPEV